MVSCQKKREDPIARLYVVISQVLGLAVGSTYLFSYLFSWLLVLQHQSSNRQTQPNPQWSFVDPRQRHSWQPAEAVLRSSTNGAAVPPGRPSTQPAFYQSTENIFNTQQIFISLFFCAVDLKWQPVSAQALSKI